MRTLSQIREKNSRIALGIEYYDFNRFLINIVKCCAISDCEIADELDLSYDEYIKILKNNNGFLYGTEYYFRTSEDAQNAINEIYKYKGWDDMTENESGKKNEKLLEKAEFSLLDIEPKYTLFTRNGDEYIVLNEGMAICIKDEWISFHLKLNNYYGNLSSMYSEVMDIIKVLDQNDNVVWERKDKKILSIEEAEEMLSSLLKDEYNGGVEIVRSN